MSGKTSNEQKLALAVLDMVAFFVALNGAIHLRYSANLPFSKVGVAPWQEIFTAFPFVALVWLLVNAAFGSYHIRQTLVEEIYSVFRATILTFLAVLSATFFYRGFSYSRGMIAFLIPLVLLTVTVGRLLFRVLRRRALLRFGGRERVAVLGVSRVGLSLIQALARDREYYDVVGVIETDPHDCPLGGESLPPEEVSEGLGKVSVLGHVREIETLCASQRFDSLVMARRDLPETVVLDSIEACLRHQVTWNMVPGVHDLLLDRARVDLVDGIPLIGMRRSNIVGFNWMVKRIVDWGASLILLVLAAPLMLAVAAAIKLSSPGPVFYVQRRVGYRGQVFPFFKFRSMHLNNDDEIHREYMRKWITENRAHSLSKQTGPFTKSYTTRGCSPSAI